MWAAANCAMEALMLLVVVHRSAVLIADLTYVIKWGKGKEKSTGIRFGCAFWMLCLKFRVKFWEKIWKCTPLLVKQSCLSNWNLGATMHYRF